MEIALEPDSFIDYRNTWEFVEGLEEVKEQIDRLIMSEPTRAVDLLETFIAGCYEKADEIDDSSGSFGQFVEGLFCKWIKARQAAEGDPHEIVKQLLNGMSDDNYGFCYEIEKDAVKALNKAGLCAFAEIASEEWTRELGEVQVREKGDKMTPGSFRLRWLSDVLRAIYAEQRDAQSYLLVAEEMGLTPRDCETLAEIYEKRRKPEEALTWVDRGLEPEREKRWPNASSWDLPERKRRLLKKLGKGADALQSAWSEFEENPSEYSYKALMRYVPKDKRSKWYAKVLKVIQGAELSHAIELYVELKEWEKLAKLVRKAKAAELEDLSHYRTEPAAKKLEKRDPVAAAELYKALGLRILNAKKSKYYGAALDHLQRVKKCLEKAGRGKEWESLVSKIRAEHRRKTSFMPGFETFVSQGSVPKKPSLLERAKRRRARFRRG
jgi:hypothetical protein